MFSRSDSERLCGNAARLGGWPATLPHASADLAGMELGQDESRKDEDRAFILRLPPERAREVRQLLADNNLGALRINVEPTRAGPQQTTFRGRTGTLSMPAAAGGTDRLPLTVLDMPTLLEAYSTIDGKGGDYVKAADVSQLMVVHESDAEANALRSRRPSGRAESGITPPTYKITREFLRRKPHFASLLRLRKFNLKSTFNAIQRAERHILRVQSKGGGAPAAAVSDTEVEEIEVEDDGEKDDRLDLGDNVDIGSGGGEPYKAVDGDTYYSKNGRAYRQETNERVGFFASKVRFKLRMRPSGVYCTQAECDMPAALLLPDHQRPADYDAEQKFEGDLEKDMENEENPVDMPQPQDQEEDQMLIDDIEDNLDMEEEAQDGDAVGPNGTPPDGGEHELDAGFVEGDPTAEVEDWLNEGMGTATDEAAEPEVLAPDDEGVDEVGAPRAADDEMIVDGEPPASPQGGNIDDTGLWQVREGAM